MKKTSPRRSKASKRTDRGTSWSKMTTAHLQAILNDPYTRGIDGNDYGPYREELEQELWKRQAREHDELMAQYERDQKTYFKHLATSHKTKKQRAS